MTMPTRLIPVLSISAGVLVMVYLGLIVATILFATWQTQALSSIRDAQAAIGTLESKYYVAIGTLDSTNPYSLGFVRPTNVQYVAGANLPDGLTFAGR
ncbi:MAG: hypothetical protein AB202_01105 [Parcubacteria bacterium C7867-007]|nr:MAG: hypothetical protein AB202_01105 [Parcubacteria bacterium C7867-007]